jgi:integrase
MLLELPILRRSPALKAEELSAVAQRAVAELMHEGQSANTEASYRSALRYWAAWFGLRYNARLSLPLPAAVVLQFIVDHAQRTSSAGLKCELPKAIDNALVQGGFKGKKGALSLNTLTHRIAVLSKAHQLGGVDNPCKDVQVRELLSMTRRAYAKRGERARKKAALTTDPLRKVLETCDDSLRGKRDRALLLFAWASGGRRRSEVAQADIRFLRPLPDGEYVYELAHSKTNQAGDDSPENFKPIAGGAAVALAEWLQACKIKEGAIFRRIRTGEVIGDALSAAAVRDIVRRRCAQAGVAGDFSAHSLRSGFVTEALRSNVPLADTMALTGHKNVQSLMGYARGTTTRAAALHVLAALNEETEQTCSSPTSS